MKLVPCQALYSIQVQLDPAEAPVVYPSAKAKALKAGAQPPEAKASEKAP